VTSPDRRIPLLSKLLPTGLAFVVVGLIGCSHFRTFHAPEYVYCSARQTYLRDRVAAVSNKVGTVANGERLEVVEHGRRFVKVKTAKGAEGWLEEHMVIDQATYDKFKALHDANLHDQAVATATISDDLYVHLEPGRDTTRFLLLPEKDKLELLERASVVKPDTQNAWMHPAKKTAKSAKEGAVVIENKPESIAEIRQGEAKAEVRAESPAEARTGKHHKHESGERLWLSQFVDPNAPPMEDWWLVRDDAGRVGWVLAHRLDLDVPDEVVQYSEGQRIVGAYLLNKVSDPESKFPGGMAPDYLAVLSPYKDGLPYDFDQVRVYAWNVKKHRYEGAYRKRDIAGYLPVTLEQKVQETTGPFANVPVPVFTVKVATDEAEPALDPATGMVKTVPTENQTFCLEGETVKRIYPPGQGPSSTRTLESRARVASKQPERRRRRLR